LAAAAQQSVTVTPPIAPPTAAVTPVDFVVVFID